MIYDLDLTEVVEDDVLWAYDYECCKLVFQTEEKEPDPRSCQPSRN